MQIERTAFEKEMMESCPLLYADMVNQRPITESSMAFGFCVGPGWHPLIRELSHGIEKIIRAFPLEEQQAIRVVQVKEKFGSLRFYMSFCVEEIEELITEAENKSAITCDVCGASGRIRGTGWLSARCDEHN
jgi:hypothetical protein